MSDGHDMLKSELVESRMQFMLENQRLRNELQLLKTRLARRPRENPILARLTFGRRRRKGGA